MRGSLLAESLWRAREQRVANWLIAPSCRDIQTSGMTPAQIAEYDADIARVEKRIMEKRAAELREEGEMWLSIYAPDQVYDPVIHYKPAEQSDEECDW